MHSPFQPANAPTKTAPILDDRGQFIAWSVFGAMVLGVLLVYWDTLLDISGFWSFPQYSHGYLIPIGTLALLYMGRKQFCEFPAWQRWIGAGVILAAMAMRVYGARAPVFTLDRLSLILCLLGVVILVGGFHMMRWAGPPILFLVFMLPLPDKVNNALPRRLQTVASQASTYTLQTLGINAYREGNNIHIDGLDHPMNVAEQCSGLRMLTILMAMGFAFAMVTTHRPLWERLIIMASAIPIALGVNVIRIVVTGLLYSLKVDDSITEVVFHDFAGIIMMPMAMGFLFLEYQVLRRLVIEETPTVQSHGLGKVPTS